MSDTMQDGIRRVVGVFAHPDDPEILAGGTFARWADEGAEIIFVMATSGDKGSSDPDMTPDQLVAIREEEERRAAAALGVKDVIFLRYPDGELEPSLDLRRDIVREIRRFKPDVLVTFDPSNWYSENRINHSDHRAIGEAALAAAFPTARDRLNFLEMERDEGLAAHKTRFVYIANAIKPNTSIDISDYVETKIRSLREHKSQMGLSEGLAERIRSRALDPHAPEGAPRYIESFFVVTLRV
ncbi:MAG: PIG-L family deacetylase [Anaerolineaceae bacterium]|nr:PIG-L family deacetylase [Anaerolineaceae bacterium]